MMGLNELFNNNNNNLYKVNIDDLINNKFTNIYFETGNGFLTFYYESDGKFHNKIYVPFNFNTDSYNNYIYYVFDLLKLYDPYFINIFENKIKETLNNDELNFKFKGVNFSLEVSNKFIDEKYYLND